MAKEKKKLKLKRKSDIVEHLPTEEIFGLVKNDILNGLAIDEDTPITKDIIADIFELSNFNPVIASFVLLREIELYQHGSLRLGIDAVKQEVSKVGLLGLKASVLQSLLKLYYIETGKESNSDSTLDIVLTYENAALEAPNDDEDSVTSRTV